MYHRLLVPLDGSATAARGYREALALARVLQATVVLHHVVQAMDFSGEIAAAAYMVDLRKDLNEHAKELLAGASEEARAHGLEVQTSIGEAIGGAVGPAILAACQRHGCDLIVMGTHGRRGAARLLLGSDAAVVVQGSPVPVLLVRDSGEPAAQ
jgi:nucleotide-binding universal stress UspA family protein